MPKRIYFGKKPKNGNGNGVTVSDISDDEDEQCGINKDNQKITKVNNHIYYYKAKLLKYTTNVVGQIVSIIYKAT